MKKVLTIVLLFSFTLLLGGCGGGDDTATDDSSDDGGFISNLFNKDKGVNITTEISFYKDLKKTELTTDKFVVGTDVYVYLDIHIENNNKDDEVVNLVATVPNAEYVDAWPREGSVKPKVEVENTVDGPITTFSDISFSVKGNDSVDEEYTFLIRATDEGDGEFTVEYSGNINESGISRYKMFDFVSADTLPAMTKPVITMDNGVLNWTASTIDSGYMLQINDELYENYAKNSFDTAILVAGDYTIEVTIKGDGYVTKDSMTTTIDLKKLDTPVVSYEDGNLVWDIVPDATVYTVYYQNEVYDVNGTSLSLDLVDPGAYSYHVVARSTDRLVVDSLSSSDYTVIKLETPVLVDNGGLYITWDSVLNATSYLVYVDGVFTEEVSTTKFRKVAGSGKEIYIVAVGTGDNVVASDDSNTVIYNLA